GGVQPFQWPLNGPDPVQRVDDLCDGKGPEFGFNGLSTALIRCSLTKWCTTWASPSSFNGLSTALIRCSPTRSVPWPRAQRFQWPLNGPDPLQLVTLFVQRYTCQHVVSIASHRP